MLRNNMHDQKFMTCDYTLYSLFMVAKLVLNYRKEARTDYCADCIASATCAQPNEGFVNSIEHHSAVSLSQDHT